MLKYLEDLRDKHEGEDIWVIGSGPSLDAYPIDFFKDKICIGVNWGFFVFLDVGDGIDKFSSRIFYSVHSHREPVDWIVEHMPDFLVNCFLILSPQSDGIGYDYRKYCYQQESNKDAYWIRNSWQPGNTKASYATFEAMVKCIMEKRNNCKYFCRGTTIHWAIEVAAVLGAKKIYVVGAEASTAGKTFRMYKHGAYYPKENPRKRRWIRAVKIMQAGTKALAKAFAPYGVNVVSYYYDKGEQKL